jgi:hypothetical protein
VVGRAQRLRDLAGDPTGPGREQRSFVDRLQQRSPAQQLHHDEREPLFGDPEIGDRDHVRMTDAAHRRSFTAKARAKGVFAGEIAVDDLDGVLAIERVVAGPIDSSHTSSPEVLDDLVTIDRFADEGITSGDDEAFGVQCAGRSSGDVRRLTSWTHAHAQTYIRKW